MMHFKDKSSHNTAKWLILAIILTGFIGAIISISEIAEYAPEDHQNTSSVEPKAQSYGYSPYGIYVDGPTYVQRRVNDYSYTSIQFRAVHYAGDYLYNQFSYYRTIINSIESPIQYFSDSYNGFLYFSIYDYLSAIQIVPIKLQVYHSPTETWFNHTFILNITSGIYIVDSIPNHFINQYSSDWLYWDVVPTYYDYYNSYYYELYIDGNLYSANTMGYYSDYGTDYQYFGYNQLGVHTVEFRVRDLYDLSVAVHKFNVTVVPPTTPQVNYANMDCWAEYKVGMGQSRKITFSCWDGDYDLDRALIFAGEPRKVVGMVQNIVNDVVYEFIITDSVILKLLGTSDYLWITFYIQALDRSRKISSPYSNQISFSAKKGGSYNLERMNSQQLSIGPTLNPVSFNFTEMNWDSPVSQIEYKITFALKSQILQTVTISAATCQVWRDSSCFSMGGGNCEVGYSQEFENYMNYDAGMIFIISPENVSAMMFPIKVKLVYPVWLEPVSDEFTQEPPLTLMRYRSNCDWNYWERVDSSDIESVGIRTVQFTLDQPGTYFYGKYREDYNIQQSERPSGIPGFPVELTLLFMGITLIGLIRVIVKKRSN